MVDVKIYITQKDMTNNKWRWAEVHSDGFQKDHCPYDTEEEAKKKAIEAMEYFQYSYEIWEGDPPDVY